MRRLLLAFIATAAFTPFLPTSLLADLPAPFSDLVQQTQGTLSDAPGVSNLYDASQHLLAWADGRGEGAGRGVALAVTLPANVLEFLATVFAFLLTLPHLISFASHAL